MRELTRGDLTEIGLLNAEEYEKNKKLIPLLKSWWWLCSPGAYNNNAAYVFADGDIYPDGYFVYKEAWVRPALTLNPALAAELKPGDQLSLGSHTATYIGADKCLLDQCIAKHIYDTTSNSWHNSELKTYMASEEFIALLFD